MKLKILLLVLILIPVIFPGRGSAQEKLDALDLYRNGQYEEAIEVCLQELVEMPNRMDAHAVLGWSYLKLKRYQEAYETSEKALKISRYDPRNIEIAGEALYYLDRHREALEYFEEYIAIALEGSRVEIVYFFMGDIYIQQGLYNKADIALSTALYHSSNVAAWWTRLGYAREKAGDFQWSLEAYNKALSLNPNLEDARRGKSRVEQRLSEG